MITFVPAPSIMLLHVHTFAELSTRDLYRILAVRSAVFVVEQKCPYQDMDGVDSKALHVWLEENGEILAYLRMFPASADGAIVQIGRVLSTRRKSGYGHQVMEAALRAIPSYFPAKRVVLNAQCYAKGFYERFGFRSVGEEFLEDDIPHIRMELDLVDELVSASRLQ